MVDLQIIFLVTSLPPNDSNFQCVSMCSGAWESGVPITPSNSQTPAGCPTIQLHSSTVYLEKASDPTGGLGLSPTWLPPTSASIPQHFSHGSQAQNIIGASNGQTSYRLEVPRTLPCIQLFCSSGSRNSEKQKEEMHRAGNVGGMRSFRALWVCHFVWIATFSPTWNLSERCPFGFLWRHHYISMADLSHWPVGIELNLQALSLPQRSCGWLSWQPSPLLRWGPNATH